MTKKALGAVAFVYLVLAISAALGQSRAGGGDARDGDPRYPSGFVVNPLDYYLGHTDPLYPVTHPQYRHRKLCQTDFVFNSGHVSPVGTWQGNFIVTSTNENAPDWAFQIAVNPNDDTNDCGWFDTLEIEWNGQVEAPPPPTTASLYQGIFMRCEIEQALVIGGVPVTFKVPCPGMHQYSPYYGRTTRPFTATPVTANTYLGTNVQAAYKGNILAPHFVNANWSAPAGPITIRVGFYQQYTGATVDKRTVKNQQLSVSLANVSLPETVSEITVMLPGGVPLVLERIPAGTFQMGAPSDERGSYEGEKPQHEVTLTQAYYLGKTEVTQAQWQAVMGTPMPSECGSYGIGDDYPVYCVSWNDICGGTTGASCASASFIGKVNVLLGTTAFRLPTEAEWERAARGGTTTEFSFAVPAGWDLYCGSFPEAEPYMWWCGNNTPYGSKPVGTKQANPFGLFDMHGNESEWVADLYGSYPSTPVTDPTGPSSGSDRVIRGGIWYSLARNCRSAYRFYSYPANRYGNFSFRLARSL